MLIPLKNMKNSTDNSHNSAKDLKQLRYINSQFLPLGGSMGPRHVLQLLFVENKIKLIRTQQPLKLEKYNCRFGILRILEFLCVCQTLKTNQILLNNICCNFLMISRWNIPNEVLIIYWHFSKFGRFIPTVWIAYKSKLDNLEKYYLRHF